MDESQVNINDKYYKYGEKLNIEEVEGYEKLKISPSGRIDFFYCCKAVVANY